MNMKKYYRDFYGSSASIQMMRDGSAKLRIRCGSKLIVNKTYNTERGAKVAMGKSSDGWYEVRA